MLQLWQKPMIASNLQRLLAGAWRFEPEHCRLCPKGTEITFKVIALTTRPPPKENLFWTGRIRTYDC